MAGRPLRPATRRRLGRPLPHQQADRPRDHPAPPELSTNPHAKDSEYPVLAPVSEGYPKAKGRLLTCYSPVRRSSTPERAFPLDLHVLSTPPAFVLSQDQTLQQKPEKSVPTNKPIKPIKQLALAYQKHPVEFSKNNHTPTPTHPRASTRATTQTYPTGSTASRTHSDLEYVLFEAIRRTRQPTPNSAG